jgi:CheY-like chemotaxis protein
MVCILIIDDNNAASAFLKLSLQGRCHRVIRGEDVWDAIAPGSGIVPDLVLINRDLKNHSGWQAFNFLKQAAPHLPAMVYVLEHLTAAYAGWISGAVEMVIPEIMRQAASRGASSGGQGLCGSTSCRPAARIAPFRQVCPENRS